jgi:hypothetical protein
MVFDCITKFKHLIDIWVGQYEAVSTDIAAAVYSSHLSATLNGGSGIVCSEAAMHPRYAREQNLLSAWECYKRV